MNQSLLSVGIDIGTSTTQLVLSRLTVENRANPFSVPRLDITNREILYRSPIHFTPLADPVTIDADRVRDIVAEEYRRAGIAREEVETGAVIITGETARKENARQVLDALSDFAGDFVVATAGPDLESVLAARGAGADRESEVRYGTVLNFDVGGGTANLALFDKGELAATGCYDIGGRLVRYRDQIDYVAPVLESRFPGVNRGEVPDKAALQAAVTDMAQTLAQAAGLFPQDGRMEHYATAGAAPPRIFHPDAITFSGGVADCLWDPPADWQAYGDIGPLLGAAIREAFTPAGERLIRSKETIRATVVGAGSHATQLSGSTVYYRDVPFPLKNLPVLRLTRTEQELPPVQLAQVLREKRNWYADQTGSARLAVGLEGFQSPSYQQVVTLAKGLALGLTEGGGVPVCVLERDMAKALGQVLAQKIAGPLLCLDGVAARQGDYIDVGTPIAGGTVLPVVVKTLAFHQ